MDRRERFVPTEIVGSRALNLASYERKEREFTDEELKADIVSYLAEYRLNIPKYRYQLKFIDGKICDKNGEPMVDKAARAIKFKRLRGENTEREDAEFLGLQRGGDQLRFVKNKPASFFWGSPPGRREDGYGDYGFFFAGEYNPLTANISMTAIRVENAQIPQFNKAMSLLTGRQFGFSKATDFLSSPAVVEGNVDEGFTDRVLESSFSFKRDQKKQETSNRIIQRLDSRINEFVQTHQGLSREEKLRLFNTLENYAIKLKERLEDEKDDNVVYLNDYGEDRMRLMDLSVKYGYKAPIVGGSCGGTGEEEKKGGLLGSSNNILSFGFEALRKTLFGEDEEEYDFTNTGNCRDCGKSSEAVGLLGPCFVCRACDRKAKTQIAA